MIKQLFKGAPRKRGYADAADFLRPACAFLIGWYHIWQQSWQNPNLYVGGKLVLNLYPVVSAGYMFVDLMLLLSGFLLMLGALERKDRGVLSFYRARFARIYPSYLFCVAVMLFVFALPGKAYPTGSWMRKDVFSHLTLTHTLFYEGYLGTQLNGVLWTLSVEAQFYLIFPLLAIAFRKKPWLTYALMTAAGLVSRHFAAKSDMVTFYMNQLPCMLDVYANGMLAAYILHKLRSGKPKPWRAWLATLLTLAACVAIYWIVRDQSQSAGKDSLYVDQMAHRLPLALAGAIFLVSGSRSIALLRRAFSNRLTRFLGGISFNFYIWHQFLACKLKEWHIPAYEGENPNFTGQQPWQWQYTLICFAAALLAAILVTYLIEKPCARALRGESKKK